MSEYRSTLDLVDNEEQKIRSGSKVSTLPDPTTDGPASEGKKSTVRSDQVAEDEVGAEDVPKSRRKKLPSIVEGDFSPLGLTSFKQSFFAKIREARSQSTDELSFLIIFLRVTSGPCFWFLCLVVTLITPLLMLFIGGSLFNQCPSHPSLPPLMILIGLLTSLGNAINIVDSFIGWKTILGFSRQNGDWTRIVIVTNITINICDSLLILLLGLIILFTSAPPLQVQKHDNGSNGDYCNPMIYIFCYWLVFLLSLYLALIVLLLASSLAVTYIKTHLNANRDSNPPRKPNSK